jgi:hypothetical protein
MDDKLLRALDRSCANRMIQCDRSLLGIRSRIAVCTELLYDLGFKSTADELAMIGLAAAVAAEPEAQPDATHELVAAGETK